MIRISYLLLFVILISVGVTSAYAINITLGGTVDITEILNMMGNKITNLGTPTVNTDAATKGYVDSVVPNPIPSDKTVSVPSGTNSPGCEGPNECFIPFIILVNKGDTVIWTNNDSASHTVTSGTVTNGPSGIFDSSLLSAGNTFEFTFNESGTFPYLCSFHPWQTGEVLVI